LVERNVVEKDDGLLVAMLAKEFLSKRGIEKEKMFTLFISCRARGWY